MKVPILKTLWLSSLIALMVPIIAWSDIQLKEYWMVEEYFSEFPQQKKLSDAFNRKVQADTPSPLATHKPVKISIIYPGQQVSDYWRRSVASFTARLKQMDIPYELDSLHTKPGVEIALQIKQIRKSLGAQTDYLVFTLDALRHKNLIERIIAQGRTKVILQNITTPLKAFGQQQPFLYVGFDHSIGANMLAQRYMAVATKTSEYAILFGTKGYVSKVRGGVFQDTIASNTDMKLVASYYVDFNRDKAATATREILKNHPNINFIYACSTDIALGVSDVLAEAGLTGKVLVNGWGGGSSELAAIQDGRLSFTVMRMNDDNGVAMAHAIALDIQGKAGDVPTLYSGDFHLVDQNMSAKDIEALKRRAFRLSQ